MNLLQMNSLWVVLIGAIVIYLGYNYYARRIDRTVIQADPNRATPARMYMDGADFMPTSRFVLYGYHFKSIAAAGPIVGVITAANLWGWLPSILWLMIGVTFIGWASDYSAIMMAVRNDGNSLSAIAHKLISPRTRRILFVFIFFYLLLIGGAFVGIMAAILAARPDVPFGILVLALMGLLAGWLIYRRRADLIAVTVVVVGVTLAAMAVGPLGATFPTQPGQAINWSTGPVSGTVQAINTAVNSITGPAGMYQVVDPTNADPRVPAPVQGQRPRTATFDPATGAITVLPSFLFWSIMLLVFSYLGTNLAIWRFAQPVNYIGFWVTALTIGVGAIGAVLAPFIRPDVAAFKVPAFTAFAPAQATGAIQWLWPMLFVTIACGAISGWHALFGSVGTARQLEYETDALPVGGGGMFSENTLGLLSLTAVAVAGGAGAAAFAAGVGTLLNVATFGLLPTAYGTALGFGAFVVIVLTVVQLVFRVMRVTLGEWLGDRWVGFKNQHIATVVSSVAVLALVLSGTWVYLWQLFGASNQLLAALSLLLVTLWLASTGRNPAYAGIPMVFMYVTTIAAALITAYNLFATIAIRPNQAVISVIGAWGMIVVALLLVAAALLIAWDGWRAWNRYRAAPLEAAPAPTAT
jgi:carbon starvation protein